MWSPAWNHKPVCYQWAMLTYLQFLKCANSLIPLLKKALMSPSRAEHLQSGSKWNFFIFSCMLVHWPPVWPIWCCNHCHCIPPSSLPPSCFLLDQEQRSSTRWLKFQLVKKGWVSTRFKICQPGLWLALFQWKTILEKKSKTELWKPQPRGEIWAQTLLS